MKSTQRILAIIYIIFLLSTAVIYLCCELFDIDLGFLVDYKQLNIVVQMIIIIITLSGVPLSLRLFKFKRVKNELHDNSSLNLKKWGMLRIFILGSLLVVNTLLYYLFGCEPSYGYLSVIVLISMLFVMPTMERCLAETSIEPITEPLLESEPKSESQIE